MKSEVHVAFCGPKRDVPWSFDFHLTSLLKTKKKSNLTISRKKTQHLEENFQTTSVVSPTTATCGAPIEDLQAGTPENYSFQLATQVVEDSLPPSQSLPGGGGVVVNPGGGHPPQLPKNSPWIFSNGFGWNFLRSSLS